MEPYDGNRCVYKNMKPHVFLRIIVKDYLRQ